MSFNVIQRQAARAILHALGRGLREELGLEQFRWWSADELPLASERLTPLSLADIVARYREHGAPREPLELEVLVD